MDSKHNEINIANCCIEVESCCVEYDNILALDNVSFSIPKGSFIGVLPAEGGTVASLIGYSEAKRWSKNPKEFV